MMKLLKKHPDFFIIMLQSIIGISVGFLVLFSVKTDTVLANTKMGTLSVAGLTFNEAQSTIESHYDDIITKSGVSFEIDKDTYKIPYSEFDMYLNLEKTMENLTYSIPQNELEEFFYKTNTESFVEPVFSYNSGKLIPLLEKIFKPYEIEAIPERYEVVGDVLKLIPEEPGIKVDYVLIEDIFENKILASDQEPIVIDTKSTDVFIATTGENRYKEKFTTLITKVVIPIEPDLVEKARIAIEPLQGVVIEKGQEINLASMLDFSQFSSDLEKDLLNRISTGVYQSAIPIDKIKIMHRTPSSHAVSYTDSGLEAVIKGENANLILKNETDRSLMLLIDATNDKLAFHMASTGEIKSGILITQKKDPIPPPTITTVNKSLSPNEKKVISPGSSGYTISVSLIIDDDRVELYQDKYQPVSKIVEIGAKSILTTTK